MRCRCGRLLAAALAFFVLAGCAETRGDGEKGGAEKLSVPSDPSHSPTDQAAPFPTAAFADISEDPVSKEMATEFEAALRKMAGGGGMAATVMYPDGTWSGAVGKADRVRDMRVDDQFAIASVTKTVVAAQVMQMAEAGELALDDPVADHLAPDFDFDTNGATIRQLLGHRSGIRDYYGEVVEAVARDPKRDWTAADLLELVPTGHLPPGESFVYSDTNYLLLGLAIEHIRGRTVAEALRDGVLAIEGVERLIYQPHEVPTEPMAMPNGESTAVLKKGGGYLPSLAGSTTDGPGAAMASDAPSLARWWRAFCAGEIVSQESLTEMATFDDDDYGLGLFDIMDADPPSVGHAGAHIGYVSWAGCLPDSGAVIVVLHNRVVEDIGGMARPLVTAITSSDR